MKTTDYYLTYKIGNDFYATNAGSIRAIIECTNITSVPNSAPYVLGIIDLRGEVLPIIDGRGKLGQSLTDVTSNHRIIVLEYVEDEVNKQSGLLVDSVSEVIQISQSEIKSAPDVEFHGNHKLINGIIHNDKGMLLLLNTEQLLASA